MIINNNNNNKGIKVKFSAFVNEKNGHRWLSQKGFYITTAEDNSNISFIDNESFYKITGKGITKEILNSFNVGDKVTITGTVYPKMVSNDGFKTIVVL